ncbi:unnamed protein product [Sphagnum troendelagicum]
MAAAVTELAGSSVVFVPTSRIVCNSVVLCSSFLPASNACFPLLRPSLGLPSFRVWSTFVEAGGSGECANGRALDFDAAARCDNGRTLGFLNGLASRNRVLRRSVVAVVTEEGAREEIEDDDGEGYDSLEEDIGFQGEEKVEEEEEEEMGAAPVKAKQSAVRRTFRLLGNKEKKSFVYMPID